MALVTYGYGIPEDSRHVCTNYRNVSYPIRTRQVYCKPTYKKYMVRCGNQWCEGVRLVYEKYHKDVLTSSNRTQLDYSCCPGWTQVTYRSHGCNRPVCDKPCMNGGKCVRPNCCHCLPDYTGELCEIPLAWQGEQCSPPCQNGGTCINGRCECITGFEGFLCEQDVDECKLQKPCDQICYNTPGSFRCECKESFILGTDGQSCRKEIDEGTTFEAKDLEFQQLDKRLNKLEKVACCFMMADRQTNQVTKKDIRAIYDNINKLSNNLNSISNRLKNLDSYNSRRRTDVEANTESEPEKIITKRDTTSQPPEIVSHSKIPEKPSNQRQPGPMNVPKKSSQFQNKNSKTEAPSKAYMNKRNIEKPNSKRSTPESQSKQARQISSGHGQMPKKPSESRKDPRNRGYQPNPSQKPESRRTEPVKHMKQLKNANDEDWSLFSSQNPEFGSIEPEPERRYSKEIKSTKY